jgi:hypothetical protein
MAGGRVREDRLKQPLTVKVSRGRRGRPGYRLTLSQYLRFRLGKRGGRTAWFNFFIRPFGAV